MGRYPMGTIGLGTLSEYSRSRKPRPPQKSTTFIAHASAGFAIRIRIANPANPFHVHSYTRTFGIGTTNLPPHSRICDDLPHDFFALEVPGGESTNNPAWFGAPGPDAGWGCAFPAGNFPACAGCGPPCNPRSRSGCRSNSAARISLARLCAVSGNRLARLLGGNEKFGSSLRLVSLTRSPKEAYCRKISQPSQPLCVRSVRCHRAGRIACACVTFRMAGVNAERAAMRGQFFHVVEKRHAVTGENFWLLS